MPTPVVARLSSFPSSPYGPTDKAPAYGAGDSGFESQYGLIFFVVCLFFFSFGRRENKNKKEQPDAGLEPATSRLRACHSTD